MTKCDLCFYCDENTNCCKNEQECTDYNMFERKQLTPMEMFKALYVLLRIVGPISVPDKLLTSIQDDQQLIETTYDQVNQRWWIKPFVKRKRGIITPRRDLIMPI